MATTATNFFNLNQQDLRAFFTGMAEKPYRAVQVMKWIYYQGVHYGRRLLKRRVSPPRV